MPYLTNAVLHYGSGLPIPAPGNLNNNNNATLLRTTYAQRVPGQPLFLQDLNCHCFDPSTTVVLNANAWTDTPNGQFSPSAAYYNDFRYQRRPAELMSLGRIFRIKERATLLIRAEFNNIFSRTLMLGATPGTFVNPSTNRGAALLRAADGRYINGFGTINTTGVVTGERQGTLVARFQF